MPTLDVSFTAPQQATTQVSVIEALNGHSRKAWLEEQMSQHARAGARTFMIQCHFDKGGPWAGPHDLFAALFAEIQRDRPDLIAKHSLELIYVLPLLRRALEVKNPTLTDLAQDDERVRSYPVDRAFRIVHGLIDLLDEWKQTFHKNEPWFLVCDEFDGSGTMTLRFLVELMRRRGKTLQITMLTAVSSGGGSAARDLFSAIPGEIGVTELTFAHEPEAHLDPEAAAAAASDLEKKTDVDRVELIANFPKLIRLWKQAGRNDKVLKYRHLALDLYNTLGLYEDSMRYAEHLPEMAKQYAPDNELRRWAIAGKMLNIRMGLNEVESAVTFAEEILLEFTQHNHARRAVMLYTLAMLYARYQKPRNTKKGEEYLARGLEALDAARAEGSIAEGEYRFQTVFNRNGLAMIRNFQRRHPEAIQICRDCVDYLNAHLAADKHLLHRSVLLFNLAQVFNAIGSYDEAIDHFNAAIAMDPNYSEYYNDRGSVFLHSGRLKEAEADYLSAIELSPPYFEVLTNLGQCYRRMEKQEEAIDSYSKALDIEPAQVLALLGRAKAYEEMGEQEAAITDYSAAITLDGSLWDALGSRGILYYERKDLQSSLEDLSRAIDLKHDQLELFENRATVLMELGRYDDAESDLKHAATLASDDAERSAVEIRLEELSGMKASL